MSVELVTLLMFGCLLVFLILGLPIGFTTGGLAVLFAWLLLGPASLYTIASYTFSWMGNYAVVAVPMFIFMANMLANSGVVDDLFSTLYVWAGPLRGGLAIITVIISTIMAAMVGIVGATEVTMGLVALPAMLKRKYEKGIALGCICAGGALGYLIPPSILSVIYGMTAGESVGKLFMGGIMPGLLLSTLFIAYIGIRAYVQPEIAPALTKEERIIPFKQKLGSLKSLVLPIFVVVAVLGSIYLGVASITESAGVGAIGAIVCAAANRRLNWQTLKDAALQTIKVTSMVVWLCIGSSAFISVYTHLGGTEFARGIIAALPLGKWGILIMMQIILLIMGCFIDWVGILMLTTPIFLPIIKSLGFDPLWYGVLFNVNMQIALLSPPFGMALFYLRGAVPEGINMTDIIRGSMPFLGLQIVGLVLCMIFPAIILWLPSTMIKG